MSGDPQTPLAAEGAAAQRQAEAAATRISPVAPPWMEPLFAAIGDFLQTSS